MSLQQPTRTVAAFRIALACVVFAAVAVVVAPTAARAADDTQMMIVQYVGNQQGNEQGKKVMLVAVKTVGRRNSQMVLTVPSKDPKKSDYAPIDKVADAVKGLKQDDYIMVEVKKGQNASQKPSLHSVKPYTPKAGEMEENVYIYQIHARQQEGGKDFIGVVLMKMGETITAQVPMVKTESGNMVPDQRMIASFDGYKKDQPVEVTFASSGRNPVIATIDPYAAPEQATFVKMTEADVDGQKVDAAELTVKGKPVTAILTGKMANNKKWAPDAKLAAQTKRLKPDQTIEARLVKDGDKTWLRYFTLEKEKKGGAAADEKVAAKDDKKEPAKNDGEKKDGEKRNGGEKK